MIKRILQIINMIAILGMALVILYLSSVSNNNITVNAINDDGAFIVENGDGQFTLELNGKWRFYPNQLLTPQDILTPHDDYMFVDVPLKWQNYYTRDDLLVGEGYGTYATTVKGIKTPIVSMRIGHIYTACKIWVNGELLYTSGQISTDKNQSKGEYKKELLTFENKNEAIDLVIAVSNFEHHSGGIWEKITIGDAKSIGEIRDRSVVFELVLFGSFLFMGMYHLFLYARMNHFKSALFLGVFCFLVTVRLFIMGELLVTRTFGSIEWAVQQKIEYLTYYLSAGILLFFVYELYPKYAHKIVRTFSLIFTLLYSAMVIFTTVRFFSKALIGFQIFSVLLIIYIVVVFIRATMNKVKGALLETIGMTVLLSTIIIDILYYHEVLTIGGGKSFSIGLLIFLFIQSIVLANLFSDAYNSEKKLATEKNNMLIEINELNKNLENKITERTRELSTLVDKLNIQATIDDMTGILNRKTGIKRLAEVLYFAKLEEDIFSVCFMDINDLKYVNDHFGHKQGDDLIVNSCKLITENIGKRDVFCRMGGDEFMLVFANKTKEDVDKIIEQIQRAMDQFNRKSHKIYKMSISFGVVEHTNQMNLSIDELVEKADEKMYQNKIAYKKTKTMLMKQ